MASDLRCVYGMNRWWMVCGVVLVGCGGSLTSPPTNDGGPGNDSSPVQDSSPGLDSSPPFDGSSGPPVCPASPPGNNTSCSVDGMQCEYGTNPDPNCNQQFSCLNGSWVDESSGMVCAPQSDCPPSYASVPQNQACSPTGLDCAYPEGECNCDDELPMVQGVTWTCFPAQTGCPSPRPDIGTACNADPSLQCDYGACTGGVTLECTAGRWQSVATACPG